jgi:hypothetical protein
MVQHTENVHNSLTTRYIQWLNKMKEWTSALRSRWQCNSSLCLFQWVHYHDGNHPLAKWLYEQSNTYSAPLELEVHALKPVHTCTEIQFYSWLLSIQKYYNACNSSPFTQLWLWFLFNMTSNITCIKTYTEHRIWVDGWNNRTKKIQTMNLKNSVFWVIMACSLLKVNWHFGGPCRVHSQGRRICFHTNFLLCSFSEPQWWRRRSSEMSFDFQWTTWHYILEDRTLHNHCCENPKAYITIQKVPFSEASQMSGPWWNYAQ